MDSLVKKSKRRLYSFKKMWTFNIHNTSLQLFYTSVVSSTLNFWARLCVMEKRGGGGQTF